LARNRQIYFRIYLDLAITFKEKNHIGMMRRVVKDIFVDIAEENFIKIRRKKCQ